MWQRASRANQCPVCKRDHYCTFNIAKGLVRCTRAQSDKPSVDSHGGIAWIHKIGESSELKELAPKPPTPKLALSFVNQLADGMRSHHCASHKRETEADHLGVAPWSLACLDVGIGWTEYGREFSSWPSRDSRNRIVGITRRFPDGKKLCIKGTSNSGLFIPSHNDKKYWRKVKTLWVVEGGSDVAMAISHGMPAVGRPSNSGGSILLSRWIPEHCPNVSKVIIWGENDYRQPCAVLCGKEHCPSCFPGLYGAKHTKKDLECRLPREVVIRMPTDGSKDIREMLAKDSLHGLPCHECRIYPTIQ